MPIRVFDNRREATLELVIEPAGETYELPHLASAGVRYVLGEDVEDRCLSSVSERRIEFWCNAESCEVDIVLPSAFDRLIWELCVKGGWCGGLVKGKPTCVDDLLPAAGPVTAEEFAKLTMRADGWPESSPLDEKHLRWIETKFIEHLGSRSVDVADLRRNLARPFDP